MDDGSLTLEYAYLSFLSEQIMLSLSEGLVGFYNLPIKGKLVRCRGIAYTDGDIQELQAWYRGEEVTGRMVDDALKGIYEDKRVPREIEAEVEIACADGVVQASFHLATLRRNFQMIDDYLSDFSEHAVLSLPYSAQEVDECLEMLYCHDANVTIASIYSCLSHLNPKDPLFYFRRKSGDLPISILKQITSYLDEETKYNLLSYMRRYPVCPLSREDEILLAVLLRAGDREAVVKMTSDYPSYRFVLLEGYYESFESFSSTPFEQQGAHLPYTIIHKIQRCLITHFRSNPFTVEQLKIMFASLGVRHALLENMDSKTITLPYGIGPLPSEQILAGLRTGHHPPGWPSEKVLTKLYDDLRPR